jgi:hypothetical protein
VLLEKESFSTDLRLEEIKTRINKTEGDEGKDARLQTGAARRRAEEVRNRLSMRETIDSKKATRMKDCSKNEENPVVTDNIGLDVQLVTTRAALYVGPALGFEAPLAAAGAV